jgi:alpha-galactosidase
VTATVNGSTLSGFAQVAVVPLPPSTGYLSDRAWTSMTNGWGPIEKDRSNGESSAGDGRPLAVNGITYMKGLGAHGIADLRYALTGACSGLTAMVGVDDETLGGGTVVFQVLADAAKVYDSGVMTGIMAGRIINIPLAGVQTLGLTVTDGGDGNTSDHADWAEAKVTCPPDVTAPTVVTVTPAPGAANIPTNTSFTFTFSEPMDPATLNGRTIFLVPQAPQ